MSKLAFALLLVFIAAVSAQGYGAAYNSTYNDAPIWKVFCTPIYHGRVDSLVDPGNYSGHIHKVFGANHFSASLPTRTPLEVYEVNRKAPCTSCSLSEIDLSQYWTTDLYYQWENGTLSLVPNSGLTVYYLSRGGSTGANRTNPNWQPIPPGLRMLAGNSLRRWPDGNSSASNAITFVCLTATGMPNAPETNTFQTKDFFCANGFRAQVFFPMCWDGVNLDSPNHQDHMSYPVGTRPDGGDCPNSHPVRIPGIFYEHFYSVDLFPHGDGTRQPFVWSNGDNNGAGFHGDFVSGWDPTVMAEAIKNPQCSNNNNAMAFGNNVLACPPMAPYVKPGGADPSCLLHFRMPTTENLGLSNPISHLPGCNPISAGPAPGIKCSAPLSAADNSNTFFIKSVALNTYVTADKITRVLYSNYSSPLTLQELWAYNPSATGPATSQGPVTAGLTVIQNQEDTGFISAQSTATLVGGASTWELWTPVQYGQYWAFKSNRAPGWLTVASPGNTVGWNAVNVTNTELFQLMPNNGGYVDLNDGYDAFAVYNVQGAISGAQAISACVTLVALLAMMVL